MHWRNRKFYGIARATLTAWMTGRQRCEPFSYAIQVVSIVCVFFIFLFHLDNSFLFCAENVSGPPSLFDKVNAESDWCGHKCILPNEWACVVIRLSWMTSISLVHDSSRMERLQLVAWHTLPPSSRFDFRKFVSIDQFFRFPKIFRTLSHHITYVRIILYFVIMVIMNVRTCIENA